MCVCLRVCVHVREHECECVSVCVFVCVQMHAGVWGCGWGGVYVYKCVHACVNACVRVLAVLDTCRDWVEQEVGHPRWTLAGKRCKFWRCSNTIHHVLQMFWHYSPSFPDILTLFTKFCRCTDYSPSFADVLTLFTKFCRCTDTIHQVFANVLTLFIKFLQKYWHYSPSIPFEPALKYFWSQILSQFYKSPSDVNTFQNKITCTC